MEAIRQIRIRGLVDDDDWGDLERLGFIDVLLVPTLAGVLALVVLHSRGKIYEWALGERSTEREARGAARLLLQGIAGVYRLTNEKIPWSPTMVERARDLEFMQTRTRAVDAALSDWYEQIQRITSAKAFAADQARRDEERRRRAEAGAPIRDIRKRWRLTQAQLAERTGVKASIISAIERGTLAPDPEVRARLANELDADPDTLFAGFAALEQRGATDGA